MTNPDSVLKSRDIILPTKVVLVNIKKSEHQRSDAFELWYWRRPLDSKEIKPVNLKGDQP